MICLFYNRIRLTLLNKLIDRLRIERFIELIVNTFSVLSLYLYIFTSKTFRQQLIKLYPLKFPSTTLNNNIRIKLIDNNILPKQIHQHKT